MSPLAAVLIAGVMAGAGTALGWLTGRGGLAAAVVGAAVCAGMGAPGAVLLGLFFVTGSAWSRRAERHGVSCPDAKSGPRDYRQVLANGVWAAAGALVALAQPSGWTFAGGALAAAQADTWATEIGAFARHPPRLLTTWRLVPRGTSGGVSGLGTVGGVLGALVLGASALALGASLRAGLAIAAGGLVGMTADSLLGATRQARFRCPRCSIATEQPIHRCGASSSFERGWRWLDNDWVNFLATGIGGTAAVTLAHGL